MMSAHAHANTPTIAALLTLICMTPVMIAQDRSRFEVAERSLSRRLAPPREIAARNERHASVALLALVRASALLAEPDSTLAIRSIRRTIRIRAALGALTES